MKAISLFSGIGGMDRGFELAGIETVLQVERDPYCLAVLEKHWPNVRRVTDVRDVGGWVRDEFGPIDVVYGGPPCQPASIAGKKLGPEDERWLWGEAFRVVREVRPRYAVMENPTGVFQFWGDILSEVAESGYDCEWDCIPASAVGAPHRRDRVFLVAYPHGEGLEGCFKRAEPGQLSIDYVSAQPLWRTWPNDIPEPVIIRGDDGFSSRMERLRALGNAVVPQVAEYIGRRLMNAPYEEETKNAN